MQVQTIDLGQGRTMAYTDDDELSFAVDRLNRCHDVMARFTMLPADFVNYETITRDFLESRIAYGDFRDRMSSLLAAPRYVRLRLYFDARHGKHIGMPEPADNSMLRWTAVNFVLYYTFLRSVHVRGTIWDHITDRLGVEAARQLADQMLREWTRLLRRRYDPGGTDQRPGPPIGDPQPEDLNPEVYYREFLTWKREYYTRRGRTDAEAYDMYDKVTVGFMRGYLLYGEFEEAIRALLLE